MGKGMGRRAVGAAARTGVTFEHTIGTPGPGSAYGQARFIDCKDGILDGFYPDDGIEALRASGDATQFAANDGRLLPASVIGENTAINLFIGGAAEIEDPVVNDDEARTLAAMAPVMALVLGGPTTPGVVDFLSAGRLWALTGYALRKDYMTDRDMVEDAKRLYEGALAMETAHGRVDPLLVFEGSGSGPAPR